MSLRQKDVLAIHLHRALDDSWYAVATIRGTDGQKSSRIVREKLPDATMETIIGCIETDEPFRQKEPDRSD